MADDPFDQLKNMPIQPVKGFGNEVRDGVRITQGGLRAGLSIGRGMSAWMLRRRLEKEGYDPITIEAAVEAVKAGREPDGILAAAQQAYRARRKLDEMRTNPPPIHGSAAWALPQALVDAGFLGPETQADGRGILLGKADSGQPLQWAGESHLLTVAPTRTGKATMQIIPNLLHYRGSAVVLDPKGELALATARWRAENVGPVYILNPFDIPQFNGVGHAFNPLDHVKDERDATKLAEMIYPRTDDDRQRFFDNEAIGFLSGVILFNARYAPEPHRNFGTIRDTLSSLSKDFYGLLRAMSDPVMPAAIRNAAQTVQTKTRDVGQPRLIDSLSQYLRIWDTPGLRQATAQSDFDFRALKDAPATVYLVLPFEEINAYGTYVQMVFAAALDAMLANQAKPDIPVLFVLDEFLALEADDRFINALRTHASAGVRLWFFLQDLPTLEQKYPTTWKSFFQAEVKTFFGTDDPHTAELVSNYLGDTTVAYESPNTNMAVGGGGASYSISDNVHLTGRKLLNPDEVIRLLATTDASKPRKAVHFLRGVAPVQATLTPWFSNETCRTRHGNWNGGNPNGDTRSGPT
ncbi:type IV secretory system conjugative DNA transfer family protein [Rhodobium gokarnense]|uniref:Type IV secretion system protein VirD4 n=1 Tax=Rhodobium gokarnense TaxID=364296 RepID=A0ABT3HAF3_9HYPH|nr:type IV secretory system conjugative DNA transfer family protein [Rhodobium gokarnense]MCW2307382.1 type IV secretion system protein VirD4 [Rhodobium gokarnense]